MKKQTIWRSTLVTVVRFRGDDIVVPSDRFFTTKEKAEAHREEELENLIHRGLVERKAVLRTESGNFEARARDPYLTSGRLFRGFVLEEVVY